MKYLDRSINFFYSKYYTGYGKHNNPDFLNILKNTYNNEKCYLLIDSKNKLENLLSTDISELIAILKLESLTVCVVPRAKAEENYSSNQLLFRHTVSLILKKFSKLNDGTNYIIRHTNTKTTHLPRDTKNYCNDGEEPYPGITKDTCDISPEVEGKDILLIDDIYTKTVNIDEDAIQALLDNGAKSVTFYAVAKTIGRY